MKSIKKITLSVLVLFSFMLTAINMTGCSKDNPMASGKAQQMPEIVESNIGPVQILQVSSRYRSASLQKPIPDSSKFYIEQFIVTDKKAELEIVKNKIKIEKYTFAQDFTVAFEWVSDNYFEGYFISKDPAYSNTTFDIPAEVELSFKKAHLGTVNTDSLGLFQFNEANDQWEQLDAEIKLSKNEVKFNLDRFGKVALFERKDGGLKSILTKAAYQYYAKKLIKANKGGKIDVGDSESGKSEIEFEKYALPEDMTILFDWVATGTFEGMLNNMEFGPHGTQFNIPVKVELSYKMADLDGIPEETLSVFYYHEDTGIWEYIGGTVDTDKKIITVYLNHFSRYAVAYGG